MGKMGVLDIRRQDLPIEGGGGLSKMLGNFLGLKKLPELRSW